MPRGPPQKYQNRATCSICIESEIKKVAQKLDIDFSRALTHGLQFLIDYRIKSGEKVAADVLEDWQKVKETALSDLREYLKIEQDRQLFLSDIIETKKKADKNLNEEVYIWDDLVQKYRTIPRKEYDPNFHTIMPKPGRKR